MGPPAPPHTAVRQTPSGRHRLQIKPATQVAPGCRSARLRPGGRCRPGCSLHPERRRRRRGPRHARTSLKQVLRVPEARCPHAILTQQPQGASLAWVLCAGPLASEPQDGGDDRSAHGGRPLGRRRQGRSAPPPCAAAATAPFQRTLRRRLRSRRTNRMIDTPGGDARVNFDPFSETWRLSHVSHRA